MKKSSQAIFIAAVLLAGVSLTRTSRAETTSSTLEVAPKLETQVSSSEPTEARKSLTPSIDYKSDAVTGVRGGTSKTPTFLGAVTIGIGIDFEKLLSAPRGLTGFVESAAIYGQAPTDRVGDFQGTDNIASPHGIEISQAWLQQNILSDRVSLLGGLHDLGSEFYVTETSSAFLNNSFGVGPELSRSGRVGPSLWPTTSLGARIRVEASDTVRVSAAVYDGVPGDPDHPGHTAVLLRDGDGVMAISEIAVLPKLGVLNGKYGIGAWAYDRSLDDLSETDENGIPLKAKSLGLYFLADQKLFAPHAGDAIGLSGFFRLGWASANTDPIEYAAQAGFVYTGLLPKREQDQLGLGAALARPGSHYRQLVAAKGSDSGLYESSVELTYRLKPYAWLMIQPDFQWIVDPNMNRDVQAVFVASGRIELSL